MTAPSLSPERHTELAEALAGHEPTRWDEASLSWLDDLYCSCGAWLAAGDAEPFDAPWRTHLTDDVLAPLVARWLAADAVKVERAIERAGHIEPQGSPEWVESGVAMRATVIHEIRQGLE